MWASRFDATGQAIPDRSKARPDVLLREDVYGRLRGLVRRLERCAQIIEAAPEARVVGAIHCGIALSSADNDDGGGAEMAAAMVVLGGMRTGARAGEVNDSMALVVQVRAGTRQEGGGHGWGLGVGYACLG